MLTTFFLHYSPDKYSELMDAMVEVLQEDRNQDYCSSQIVLFLL